jgi:hypothetical protein
VNPWWWVPIGLAAWFLVATGVGMLIGRILRHSSQARDSLDRKFLGTELEETPDRLGPPRDERQAS